VSCLSPSAISPRSQSGKTGKTPDAPSPCFHAIRTWWTKSWSLPPKKNVPLKKTDPLFPFVPPTEKKNQEGFTRFGSGGRAICVIRALYQTSSKLGGGKGGLGVDPNDAIRGWLEYRERSDKSRGLFAPKTGGECKQKSPGIHNPHQKGLNRDDGLCAILSSILFRFA